jgi:hypothetical protein
MDTAEDFAALFHAVAHYPAVAVGTNRARAWIAVECVMLVGNDYFKRFVIFIFANFAYSHTSFSREAVSLGCRDAAALRLYHCAEKVEIARESDTFPSKVGYENTEAAHRLFE